MSEPPDVPVPETVTVICPTCGTPLHPRVVEEPQTVRCPDCHVDVRVPPLAEVLERLARKRRRSPESPGTYRILTAGASDPQPEKGQTPSYVLMLCRICDARLHPQVRDERYQIRCPDCHELIDVPAKKDIPAPPRRTLKTEPIGVYVAGTAHARPQLETSYLEVQAEIRREADDPPPRWTFFSGVFSFPWSEGVLPRWGFLAVGYTALLLLLAWIASMASQVSGYAGVTIAFLALPAIWIGLWTFSYSAACCLPVLTDTAAGMNRITNWPDPVWKEWMADLIYAAFIAALAIAVGYGVGKLSDLLGGGFWIACVATSFLLFPVFLLSSLEADSAFVPLSGPILRSLVSLWWGWLLFYLFSAMLVGGSSALPLIGARSFPWLAAFFAGPLTAAVLLILARLLGRLAWRASLLVPDENADEL